MYALVKRIPIKDRQEVGRYSSEQDNFHRSYINKHFLSKCAITWINSEKISTLKVFSNFLSANFISIFVLSVKMTIVNL